MTNGMNRPAPREYSVEESVLKELIKREMLDAAGDPHVVQRVFDRYKGSRIPSYMALGEANVELRGEYQRLAGEVAVAQDALVQLHERIQGRTAELQTLASNKQELEQHISDNEVQLAEQDGVLQRVGALGRLGFGEGELTRLYEALASLAASRGAQPGAAAASFFELFERYEKILMDDLEAERAATRADQHKAEAGRWEASNGARTDANDPVHNALPMWHNKSDGGAVRTNASSPGVLRPPATSCS